MSDELVLEVKSIGLSRCNGHKPCTLAGAAKHNKRKIAAELEARGRIDSGRTSLNYSLAGAGDVDSVLALAVQRLGSVGLTHNKMRRDYCQAVEVMFSLPAGTPIDTRRYFDDCLTFCAARFGVDNIMAADVHLDEANPHLHILIAPIEGGRWAGGAVITKDRVKAMREAFSKIAGRYGLKMSERLTGSRKGEAVAMVLQAIETGHSALFQSPLWQPVRKAIERNPEPFMASLSLTLTDRPAKKLKTMTQIFTSPGKGAKRETLHLSKRNPIGIESPAKPSNPIGIDRALTGRNEAPAKPIGIEKQGCKKRSPPCVGIDLTEPTLSPRFKPASTKVTEHRNDVVIDDDGVVHGLPDVQVIKCDDGLIRERFQIEQPDGYDQAGSEW